jgi:alkanesulfonate monooxygenase SsuD/methylene tetrahydromethanopterin reductase-like flavin-dependent oxidoreductase (luciferase family)
MRWAVPIPQFVDDRAFDPVAFRAYLGRAEELGFESAWALEQVLGAASLVSALEVMTYAAACSERLRLGCVVFVTPLHQPVHLAKSLSSLDQLSRGRLEVGIGIGGTMRPFGAFEVDPRAGLIARFNEGLQLMRALWTESRVTCDGAFWKLEGEPMEPKPFQKPGPPVWFGGSAPAALRRAVKHGDGFFGAGSTTTAAFAQQVTTVRGALEQQGRDKESFPIAKRLYVTVDDDAARARERTAAGLYRVYGEYGKQLEPVAVSGPPDACVDAVREVAAAGAELILLNPLFDQAEQVERLAAEVMPHVD